MKAVTVSTGTRFGRWIVLGQGTPLVERVTGCARQRLRCRCDCGSTRDVMKSRRRSGKSRSCGCLQKTLVGNRARTHGDSNSPEYRSWRSMLTRCLNPRHHNYHNYGGRGITVCDRWRKSFAAFLEDVGPRPSRSHTLDRFPDNNGNYEPDNVRWATPVEQHRNTRTNRMITFRGETLCVSEWAGRVGHTVGRLFARLSNGWSVERALTEPVNENKSHSGNYLIEPEHAGSAF